MNSLKKDIGNTLTVTLISSSNEETKTAATYGVRGINELLCILNS